MNRVLHFTTNERHRQPGYGAPEYVERFHVAEEVADTGYYVNGFYREHTDLYTERAGTRWQVIDGNGRSVGFALEVGMPSYSSMSASVRAATISYEGSPAGAQGASLMYACGEMLKLAAAYAEHLTQAYEATFAEQAERDRKAAEERERERAERLAAARKEREEWEAKRRAAQEKRQTFVGQRVEDLQWYLEQPMRLRRHGKKSVVMGQVVDINERNGRMTIISERGARLTTYVDALEHFEIKYEGDRTYTVIDLSPPPEGVELRRG